METFRVLGITEYEYDIFVTKDKNITTFDLHASNSDIWKDHMQGKLLLRITDDGNNLNFNKKLKTVNYGDAGEVRLLINFERWYSVREGSLEDHYQIVQDVTENTL